MASGKVMEIRDRTQIPLRDDFYIEHYANNPQTTPEDQLITEILVPTK
jgi:DNA gyrase inhibitor GyrI